MDIVVVCAPVVRARPNPALPPTGQGRLEVNLVPRGYLIAKRQAQALAGGQQVWLRGCESTHLR